MNYYEKKAVPFIKKIKQKIDKKIRKAKFKDSISLIEVLSKFLYHTNQRFVDEDLENYTEILSLLLLDKTEIIGADENKVLFYDYFGVDNRGLAQIYLKALCEKGCKIIYLTSEDRKDCFPEILSIVKKSGTEPLYIKNTDSIEKAKLIKDVIVKEKPRSAFFYSIPSDVAGVMAFTSVFGDTKKYLINLTDHAFWLGKRLFDYVIEFRDMGEYITRNYRKVDANKIVKLPFYPNVNKDVEFNGFPFEIDLEKQRVFFSGGATYKTFGDGDRYYKLVEKILTKYKDLVFWYAGSGDFSKLAILKQKFENRVYYTEERKDLYQTLKRCTFYLSTYPISGGLMFQYSAVAKKVPMTLRHNDDTSGFLLNQKDLLIEFDTEQEFFNELDKMLTDDAYLKAKEEAVFNSVLKEDEFNDALNNLLTKNDTGFKYKEDCFDVSKFIEIYVKDFSFKDMTNILTSKDFRLGLRYYPKYYLFGAMSKVKKRLFKK